ncbi:hypothetical protein DY000_02018942 [Brassica cretica]|uniref:Uncharacterized protein n=1 Tax=Brassica cretica TaxID=69181 RepID=A0ABQ7D2Z9_BRACR|nr:hypothetical protein DY000_02018942 [Brassica cretica]
MELRRTKLKVSDSDPRKDKASGSHTVFIGTGEKGHKGKQAVYQNLTPGQIASDYLMNLGAKLDR